MNKLNYETKTKPADRFLQDYQVDLNPFEPFLAMKNLKSGKAADYEVVCRDGKFGVHLYCLINSDFLYKQYEARKNFEGEGKGSNKIMLTIKNKGICCLNYSPRIISR